MNRTPLSLRENFSWTVVSNVVVAASQWLTLMAIVKLCSAQMVGHFSYALAVTAPVFMFVCLNLRSVQATDAQLEFAFYDYFSLRKICVLAGLLTVSAASAAVGYGWHLSAVIAASAVAKSVDAISDIYFGRLQQQERMDRIAISQMSRYVLQLAVVLLVCWLWGDVLWAVCGQAGVSVAVLFAYDRNGMPASTTGTRSAGNPYGRIKKLARLALPLGLVALLGSLTPNIPRYFIQGTSGSVTLAIYSAMAYIMFVGGTAASALCQAAAPRLSRHYTEDLRSFKRLLGQLVALSAANGLIGVLAAAFAGRWILSMLYRPEYAEYPAVFTWLMVAAGFSYIATALGIALTAARVFDAQFWIYLCAAAATAAGCVILVPSYGIQGAAWAFLLGVLTWCGGFLWALARAVRRDASEILFGEENTTTKSAAA